MSKAFNILADEQGNWSASRTFLALWTANTVVLLDLSWAMQLPLDNAAYAVLSGVELALVCWAAGPRIAQYIGPAIGQVVQGVGQAFSRQNSRNIDERRDIQERTDIEIRMERDPDEGIDPTP